MSIQLVIALNVLLHLFNILLIRLYTIKSRGYREHIQSRWAQHKILLYVITFLRPERKPVGMKVIATLYTCAKCHTISSPGGFWGVYFIPWEAWGILEPLSLCVLPSFVSPPQWVRCLKCLCSRLYSSFGSGLFCVRFTCPSSCWLSY